MEKKIYRDRYCNEKSAVNLLHRNIFAEHFDMPKQFYNEPHYLQYIHLAKGMYFDVYSTVHYSTLQYSTVQYSTLQYSTIRF
jgi:hypothetical protein